MDTTFKTTGYTNVFLDFGYTPEEITRRLDETFHTIFYGNVEERFYYETADMGYLVDTGNNDVRTEGMSYGMMIAVQMNKKDLFDRLWKWAKTYMWMESGDNKGYFAWSVGQDGTKNAYGPAPDGEEYFAMALLFAANRWGNGAGIFDYEKEARMILHEMVHKGEDGIGHPMFHKENKLILFVPGAPFSDPSYHLPHFFELFALWGNTEDSDFFKEAAKNSRDYLSMSCHKDTGLTPEYAYFDGKPWNENQSNHHHFYSDAYRVAANIGLDYEWFGTDAREVTIAQNLQKFFTETEHSNDVLDIDGTPVTDETQLVKENGKAVAGVLHPVGLIATNAQATLAAGKNKYSRQCVELFWNTPLRTGSRRYYDNLLYMFAWLALSGNYRIWTPGQVD